MSSRVGQGSAERSRGPLWVWPATSGAIAAAAAWALGQVRPRSGVLASLWPSDSSAPGALLQVVATGSVTITTLTLSLTVVALQMASQQFSPRLLRDFARDRVTKQVLSVFAATFVFAVTGLRGVDSATPVATLVCVGAAVLGIASFAALLAFITHISALLRVDTMMKRLHDETDRAIDGFYAPYGDRSLRSPDELRLDADGGWSVRAATSGFVRVIDVATAAGAAQEHDAVVRIEVRPGDHVTRGAPVATVWSSGRGSPAEELHEAVRRAIDLSYERTIDQDAAFGIRQLEDIAIKAMSPAINDPTTADAAVGHMADLLVRLTGRRLGAALHEDQEGVGRVVVPDRDLEYYLELACGQLRRFGADEPTVLISLLRMLRDVAVACRDDHQRPDVADAADRVLAQLSPRDGDSDTGGVHDMHRRVGQALRGRVEEAFADRAGETRSM
ncbi:DUF2254 domain-containing protein [Blastococcus sp. TF02A-30]|uniref:DUF2254 domain-containing protein n=1 Tax=Blastococcus sp. TF02A-30 TaxID=2250580 RepID=UPI000DE958B1|nr:DUF2254 domain-containing protein [Blastococcus sp. TF02A-30]RBY85010.1 hypothetical protein DQ241_17100 [Blastococcus sp. TF02A-30]